VPKNGVFGRFEVEDVKILCSNQTRCPCVSSLLTSSSAIAKRPRDASCLSVVSFNSTKR